MSLLKVVKRKLNMNRLFLVAFLLTTIGFVFLFFSCDKEKIITLKIDKETEIKLNETAKNAQKELSLKVERISDSRCPKGAWCFWEGNASVEFHIITRNETYDFTLDTHRPPNFKNDTIIEGIKYELIDVSPYPDLNKKQPVQKVKVIVKSK